MSAVPPLPRGEVHLYAARLDEVEGLAPPAAVLAGDERERAAVLVPAARREFEASRRWLRGIAAEYLGSDPAAVRFTYGPYGQPQLAGAGPTPSVSLSHAGGFVAIALAATSVGVDVESPARMRSAGAITRYLAASERVGLADLPVERRAEALLATWTRKEALAKALGLGLSLSFDTFDVPVDGPGGAVRGATPGGVRLDDWWVATEWLGREAVVSAAVQWPRPALVWRVRPA